MNKPEKEMLVLKCCFCGKVIKGYGHNPDPADKTPGARCCANCSTCVVIPARLKEWK